MRPFKLKITPTEYVTTLKSHGWFDLAPFRLDMKDLTLTLAFKVQNGDGAFKIFVGNDSVFCEVLHGKDTTVIPVAEKCLSLDVDLSEFYALVSGNENFKWLSGERFRTLFTVTHSLRRLRENRRDGKYKLGKHQKDRPEPDRKLRKYCKRHKSVPRTRSVSLCS